MYIVVLASVQYGAILRFLHHMQGHNQYLEVLTAPSCSLSSLSFP